MSKPTTGANGRRPLYVKLDGVAEACRGGFSSERRCRHRHGLHGERAPVMSARQRREDHIAKRRLFVVAETYLARTTTCMKRERFGPSWFAFYGGKASSPPSR